MRLFQHRIVTFFGRLDVRTVIDQVDHFVLVSLHSPGKLVDLCLNRIQLFSLAVPFRLVLSHHIIRTGLLLGKAFFFLFFFGNIRGQAVHTLLKMFNITLRRPDLLVHNVDLAFQSCTDRPGTAYRISGFFDLFFELCQRAFHLLVLGTASFQFRLLLCQIVRGDLQLFFRLGQYSCLASVFLQEIIDIQTFQFFFFLQIFMRLFGLFLQRSHLTLQLGQNIIDTYQVCLLAFQLFRCGILTLFKFYDTCRFIKQFTALFRFARKDLVDLSLSDNGISFLTDTGIIKQFIDIFQSAYTAIHQVFALTGTIDLSGYRHLITIDLKGTVCVIQRDRHVSKALRFAQFRTRKNDILHGCPT